MKKLLLVSAFVLGVSAVSFAQGGGRMGGTPDQQIERLKTQITGITDAQTAKLKVVYEAQAKSMDSIRTAANGDFQSMMPAFTKMRETTSAKLKGILTPEQFAAYEKQQAEMRQRMGN